MRIKSNRIVLYGFLCIALAIAIAYKWSFARRVSQYREGKEHLEISLQNDSRFRDVRIYFFSTRPSVSILAPSNLPLNAKEDLARLVGQAFAPLPAPRIYYPGTNFYGNEITNDHQ
jgi:hypothetical protein